MTVDEIKNAIAIRDYSQAVEMASTAFDSQQQLWPAILDCRAYALAMQGKFENAAKDAQEIIAIEPTKPRGYIRLGKIYKMQGKQQDAIDIYNIGLQSVSTDSEHYSLMEKGKSSATRRNERRVDFIAKLPVKVTDEIITRLPEESKLICLRAISRAWRKRFRECAKAWNVLTVNDAMDDVSWALAAPVIASHVKDLTIDTPNMRSWKQYMVGMRNGRFKNIKTLCLTSTSAKFTNMHTVMLVTNALYQINSTLTTLVLDHNAKRVTFVLAELLFALSNLKYIVYTTTQPLSNNIGQFSPLKTHKSLIDMRLKSSCIQDSTIAPLLQYCQNLRLLVLNGFNATVLDVVDSACPALEIFGYNSEDLAIPVIDHTSDAKSGTGLREFYTRRKFTPVSAATVLPFIKRNMASLKKITMKITNRGSEDLTTMMYTDLKLTNLESLTFWGDDTGRIQSLILRSISNSVMLTHLSVMGCRDMPGLVNTLIAMPQIKSLELAYIWDIVDSTSLVRLFKTYARGSQDPRTCNSIKLKCFYITDECIAALADIGTLNRITLTDLRNTISPAAVDSFFSRLVQTSTAHICLSEIDCVTDRHISTLGDIQSLESLHLDNLKNMTDAGVIAMVDKKPALERFTITNCDWITIKAFMYARKSLKYAVIKFKCT